MVIYWLYIYIYTYPPKLLNSSRLFMYLNFHWFYIIYHFIVPLFKSPNNRPAMESQSYFRPDVLEGPVFTKGARWVDNQLKPNGSNWWLGLQHVRHLPNPNGNWWSDSSPGWHPIPWGLGTPQQTRLQRSPSHVNPCSASKSFKSSLKLPVH